MDKERIRLTTLSSLVPRIDEEGRISHRFSDESASTVQSELERSPTLRDWSQAPRTFALLFTLRHGRGITDLPAARFDDDRLPYPDEPAELRAIHELSDEEIDGIICYQSWFISPPETMSTENFVERKVAGHRRLLDAKSYFKYDEKSLGRSNTAYICRVTHMPSRTDYAGKLFLRKRSDGYELFKRERSNLEKSRHHHLIDLVGTYTDRTHFVLILTPLAQYDLRTLLTANVSEDIAVDRADVLRRSFGCLASGLHHLHSIQIRHKDIKPGNILIHGGNVIICDLGIAYDWSDSEPTTDGAVKLQTRRYSAPEVLNEDKRNAKADIWSLGCVFLEIITVLKRGMITDLHNFSRFPEVDAYCTHPERIMEWVEVLRKDDSFNDPLDWIEDMVRLISVA
ncbi:hypothetical protein GTA08_BOTSDO09314 [Botryosphaeria dothidea]|uniref:Protein kinase domain-containing protein n=1 Tax=Botryosphaeria dothidea TaxID=55169 RepID=A0A8H4IMX6_9PEZI|nr:hypothetical protein GTA08_BOTSDO09314 [Botryosphaeria dothidea]